MIQLNIVIIHKKGMFFFNSATIGVEHFFDVLISRYLVFSLQSTANLNSGEPRMTED
jgi:hypothetical protein